MSIRSRRCRGFSLIELLTVLAIVGILAVVGVVTLGDRKNSAVRTVMDEIEGVLMAAQQNAVVASVDVPLVAYGTWGSEADPLIIDGRRITGTYPADAATACDPAKTPRIGTENERFVSAARGERSHMSATVLTDAGKLAIALGSAPALNTVHPGTQPEFSNALAVPLFKDAKNVVRINGVTKRFETGFYIAVVGAIDGAPAGNTAVGMLVVPANSATVYKFYKRAESSTWVRM